MKSKQLGLKLDKNEVDTRRLLQSKDFVALLKCKMYQMLNNLILKHPTTAAAAQQSIPLDRPYKFWVECHGNNHNLVKSVLKRRNWLTWHDLNPEAAWAGAGPQAAHVIWTQVRHKRILKDIGSH